MLFKDIQTDDLGTYSRGFAAYTCFLEGGDGCTQITHREVCDFRTQHRPWVSSNIQVQLRGQVSSEVMKASNIQRIRYKAFEI